MTHEFLVLFPETYTHVVALSLRVLFWETQTVQVRFRLFLNNLIDFLWTAPFKHQASLKRLGKRHSSHLLNHGFAANSLLKPRLKTDFVEDALETKRLIYCETAQNFPIDFDVGLLDEGI